MQVARCHTPRVDEPTLTYLYQYVGSAVVLAFGLWMARRAGALGRGWYAVMVGGLVAYALGHAFFQFVAPST